MVIDAELSLLASRVNAAKRPEDLFGPLTGNKQAQLKAAKESYRAFMKVVHEDRHAKTGDLKVAQDAGGRLGELWVQCQKRIQDGTYGSDKPTIVAAQAVVVSKRGRYLVSDVFAPGDVSIVYAAVRDDHETLVKVSRHPTTNAMLERESTVLKLLHGAIKPTGSYGLYLPTLEESFLASVDKTDRRVNVFTRQKEFRTLTDVRASYPSGVDLRHAVWMWKRLMTVLTFVHGQGQLHGAVLPEHVLINPENHGLMLVDWCFSVPVKTKLSVISTPRKTWYPAEVMSRQVVGPSTDIYMAAQCMAYVLGSEPGGQIPSGVHAKFRRLLEACLNLGPRHRVQDAWDLYRRIERVAEDIFGSPKFVELVLK